MHGGLTVWLISPRMASSSNHADTPSSLYLRLIDFVYHSTLGFEVIKRRRRIDYRGPVAARERERQTHTHTHRRRRERDGKREEGPSG